MIVRRYLCTRFQMIIASIKNDVFIHSNDELYNVALNGQYKMLSNDGVYVWYKKVPVWGHNENGYRMYVRPIPFIYSDKSNIVIRKLF